MRNILSYLLVIAITATFISCESNHMFKSEKKVKKDIQGKWDMIVFKSDELDQNWIFTEDSLYILRQVSLGSAKFDTVDVVDYKIDVTLSAPYMIVDGIELDPEYNKKWTITQLDTKVLALATDYKNGGVLQKEFVKR